MRGLVWSLCALAALLLAVCLTRIRVRVVLPDGAAEIRLGWLRIYPQKEWKRSRERKAKKPDKKKKSQAAKSLPKFSLNDFRDVARTLWPPLKRALKRTRRGLRLDPLRLSLTLGGLTEPAETAELYGWLHVGMWTVMPALEQLADIPDPQLHIGAAFETEATELEGEIGISVRIGTLLGIGLGVGIPVLRWFLQHQKQNKKRSAPSAAEERTE